MLNINPIVKMKYILNVKVALLLFAFVAVVGCDDDDEKETVTLEATTTADLDATSTSKYTLFSFKNNSVVANADSATANWDIAFRGTTIILNSGVSGPGTAAGQTISGIFDELAEAPVSGYASDSESAKAIVGSNGWYTYTGTATTPNHAILPIAGKILVIKTADNKYVKMEIISYYKGNPDTTTATFADTATRPASRYYTFRFIYQPDGTTNFATTQK
jgi:hypothetical protein